MRRVREQSRRVRNEASARLKDHEAEVQRDGDGITFVGRGGVMMGVIVVVIVCVPVMPVHGDHLGEIQRICKPSLTQACERI
jgi:hypothetical protein